jgi:rubrerythrin
MTNSEKSTGTRDEHYNLISITYHALKGAELYATFAEDARRAGDKELVQFFDEVQKEESRRATRAKDLLMKRIGNEMAGMTR